MTSTSTSPGASKPVDPASGDRRQLRQLVLISAIVVSVVAAATGVFAVIRSAAGAREEGDATQDQQLVQVLEAVNEADRALYTERSDWVSAHATGRQPEPEAVDDAAKKLGEQAAKYGVDAMKLEDKGSEKQFKLLVENPADRIKMAREELTSGHVSGADECAKADGPCQATFTALRKSLYAFASKAPALFHDPVLGPQARTFAQAMGNPDQSIPVRIDQDVPESDGRAVALKTLAETAKTAAEQTGKLPVALWIVAGVLLLIAIALWLVYFIKGSQWAPASAPAPKKAAAAGAPPKAGPAGTKDGGGGKAKRLPLGRDKKPPAEAKPAKAEDAPGKGPVSSAKPATAAAAPAAAVPKAPAGAQATESTPVGQPGGKKRRVPFAPAPGGQKTAGAQPSTGAAPAAAAPAAASLAPAPASTKPASAPVKPSSAGQAPAAAPTAGAAATPAATKPVSPGPAPTGAPAGPKPPSPRPAQGSAPGAPVAKPAAAPKATTTPPPTGARPTGAKPPAAPAPPVSSAPTAPKPEDATEKPKPASGKPRVPWRTTGDK
ncbi:MAG: hypothetical protein LBC97_11245 [Bifidobacteriaceae bacterium]|jgi:flagellar basal body-associated protein FliL|nr:hypothetical protein [Bifidobacteriaceae bacterium]